MGKPNGVVAQPQGRERQPVLLKPWSGLKPFRRPLAREDPFVGVRASTVVSSTNTMYELKPEKKGCRSVFVNITGK